MGHPRQWASALLLLAIALSYVAPAASAADPSAADGAWRWPTTGRVTQRFGCTGAWTSGRQGDCPHFHKGVDIANKAGTPIRAARAGTVSYVGYNRYDPPGRRAWIVIIKHADGLRTWYAHMQPKRVSGALVGDRVAVGKLIGYMGSTGFVTGVHLHFGVEKNGRMVNPRNYLSGWPAVSSSSRTSGPAVTLEHSGTDADLPATADVPATAVVPPAAPAARVLGWPRPIAY